MKRSLRKRLNVQLELTDAIQGDELRVSILSYPGRIAARAYAYAMISLGGEYEKIGQAVLDYIGLEG
jgi:hypothetical protein